MNFIEIRRNSFFRFLAFPTYKILPSYHNIGIHQDYRVRFVFEALELGFALYYYLIRYSSIKRDAYHYFTGYLSI
jgi:hypothetical protein